MLAGGILNQLVEQAVGQGVREVASEGISTRKRSEFIAVRNNNRFSYKETLRCESPLAGRKNSAYEEYYRSS